MLIVLAETTLPCDDHDLARVEALFDAGHLLLGAYERYGQIWGPGQVAPTRGGVRVSCVVPGVDALDAVHGTPFVAREVAEVEALLGGPVTWHVQAPEGFVSPDRSTWEEEEALLLFTHAFDDTSPVVGASDRLPIPAYLLPIEPEAREALWTWQRQLRRLDQVWLDSGAVERAAWEELARVDSDLNVEGRRLAGLVEAATGKPVYLLLPRHYTFEEGEETRPCPGCGAAWHREPTDDDGLAYPFRCDPCRLVSLGGNESWDPEGWARIGAWPG